MNETPLPSYEDAALQYAREAFKRAHDADVFEESVMRATLRAMLKEIVDAHEMNATYVVQLALAGSADAHGALAEVIAERTARSDPLGPALAFYMNTRNGPAVTPSRLPRGRPNENFLVNYVIVRIVLDLMRQFPGLPLRRRLGGRQQSICSIAAKAAAEIGAHRGGEEAVRKIWEQYGPPAIPSRMGPPKPGVVRFISHQTI